MGHRLNQQGARLVEYQEGRRGVPVGQGPLGQVLHQREHARVRLHHLWPTENTIRHNSQSLNVLAGL